MMRSAGRSPGEAPSAPTPRRITRAPGVRWALLVALAAPGCGGGGESPDASAERAAQTSGETSGEAVPAGATVDTVDVFLQEYLIDIPARIPARAVLRLVNTGSEPHNLKLHPRGEDEILAEVEGLDPGATRLLEIDLRAGPYTATCDLAGHDIRGMRTDLELVPAAP